MDKDSISLTAAVEKMERAEFMLGGLHWYAFTSIPTHL